MGSSGRRGVSDFLISHMRFLISLILLAIFMLFEPGLFNVAGVCRAAEKKPAIELVTGVSGGITGAEKTVDEEEIKEENLREEPLSAFNSSSSAMSGGARETFEGKSLKKKFDNRLSPPPRTPDSRPFVVKTFPRPDETNVPVNSVIKIVFSKQMDYITINNASITVSDEVGCFVEGLVTYDSKMFTATFTPRANLAYNARYNVFIPSYLVKDMDGAELLESLSFSFETEAREKEKTSSFENVKAPKVVKHYPDVNATDVPEDITIRITFNRALKAIAINSTTVTVNDGISDIDGEVAYSEKGNSIIFAPKRPLDPGKVYKVVVSKDVESLEGYKMLSAYYWTFSTVMPRDKDRPFVIQTSPVDGAVNVSEVARISATFSEQVDPTTLNRYSIILSDGKKRIEGKIIYDRLTCKVAFIPDKPLDFDTKYTMLIAAPVKDLAGNPLREPKSWTFVTVARKTPVRPEITKTEPANNAVNVDPSAKIMVWFNKVMNEATVNVFNVKVECEKKIVPVTVEYAASGNFMNIIPTSRLDWFKKYDVTISGAIKDKEGLSLPGAYIFSFTTMREPDTTPPEIVKVYPEEDGVKIPVDTKIQIWFSEQIAPSSVTSDMILMKDSQGSLVDGRLDFDPLTKVAWFIPRSELKYLETYIVHAKNTATDMAGNRVKNSRIWKFTTIHPPDNDPPVVISVIPANGERDVPVGNPIRINFSEQIAENTLDSTSLVLYDPDNRKIKGEIRYDPGLKQAIFEPYRELAYETAYRLLLSKKVKDLAGNSLSETFVSTFTTVPKPDFTRPRLVSVHPASGSTGVPTDVVPFAVFSKRLDPLTINGENVKFRVKDSDRMIPASITYDDSKKTVLIKPSSPLNPKVTYQVIISRAIKDRAGNCPDSTTIWEFTTVEPPDRTPPRIDSFYPPDGARRVSADVSVIATFSEPLDDSTVNEENFALYPVGENELKFVPARINYVEKENRVILTPVSRLEWEKHYKVVVKGIRDRSGNALVGISSWTFLTEPEPDRIPPEIIKIVPEAGSAEQSLNTRPVAYFSEMLDTRSVNLDSVTLRTDDGFVKGKVLYSPKKKSVTFKPDAPLDFDRVYYFEISNDIMDISGNRMERNAVAHFRTVKRPDLERPRVRSIYPPNGSTMIPKDVQIVVNFTEEIKPSTINNYTFFLEKDGQTIPARLDYNPDVATARLIPQQFLKEGALYRVTLTSGVTDLAGNGLEKDISWAFTVGAPVDRTRPEIIRVYPPDGKKDVSTAAVIEVHFSEPIRPSSANKYTFVLSDGLKNLEGKITVDRDGKKAYFKPHGRLNPDTLYTMRITGGVEDLAGQALGITKEWSFRTGGQSLQ